MVLKQNQSLSSGWLPQKYQFEFYLFITQHFLIQCCPTATFCVALVQRERYRNWCSQPMISSLEVSGLESGLLNPTPPVSHHTILALLFDFLCYLISTLDIFKSSLTLQYSCWIKQLGLLGMKFHEKITQAFRKRKC